MSKFKIQRSWMSKRGNSEVDVTMSRLRVILNERTVTEYSGEFGNRYDKLEIPAYFLAEWIAENWWPLLWEPRKVEDVDDQTDFLARHSILTAEHGFALPKITIVPSGRNIHISATLREVQFADIRFRNAATALLPRSDVELELKHFVSAVVTRLRESAVSETDLQEHWGLINETSEEETQFCRFMGALGLSPYVPNDVVESILDRLLPPLGWRVVMDLCLASDPASLGIAARGAELAFGKMTEVPESTLEPLLTVHAPADNLATPAWQRGVKAAQRVRAKLGIENTDPSGGTQFFDALKIDPSLAMPSTDYDPDVAPIVGAVARTDLSARLALLQHSQVQRRFTAARAAFAAWTSQEQQERRLLTHAVTRDQQASRAFAAEMMAPFAYLRSKAKKFSLPQEQVFQLADNLNIGTDVVIKQALNNGLRIASM